MSELYILEVTASSAGLLLAEGFVFWLWLGFALKVYVVLLAKKIVLS